MYHFKYTFSEKIKKLWIICGKSGNKVVVPVHTLVTTLSADIISVLPAVHALTGCDTTSKISTKKAVLKTVFKGHCNKLSNFGKSPITEEMTVSAEAFLVSCLTKQEGVDNFNLLRYMKYQQNVHQLDLAKLPCTSESIKLHIKRAYLQSYWCNSPIISFCDIEPLDYEYGLDVGDDEEDGDNNFKPAITNVDLLPNDFPRPCTCGKCARDTVCLCRIRKITCFEYCKCEISCKSLYNIDK